jgi:hypothetical protein
LTPEICKVPLKELNRLPIKECSSKIILYECNEIFDDCKGIQSAGITLIEF